jgi:hypothetical protein
MIDYIKNKLKYIWNHFAGLCILLWPIVLLISMLCLFRVAWGISFDNYLKTIAILIWPITILIILYFFNRVVTYLFFSLDEFNFFGAKGGLKKVNEVILEQVNKKFLQEKKDRKRMKNMEKLYSEIRDKDEKVASKEEEASKIQQKADANSKRADENLKLAKEILAEWKKTTDQNKKTILELEEENRRLNDIVSNLRPQLSEVDSVHAIDDTKTSTPILDENNIIK